MTHYKFPSKSILYNMFVLVVDSGICNVLYSTVKVYGLVEIFNFEFCLHAIYMTVPLCEKVQHLIFINLKSP